MLRTLLLAIVAWSCLGPALDAQTKLHDPATVRWLQSLQTDDGGFRPTPSAELQGSLRATSAAVRSLRRFGGQPANPEAATRFVEKCWDDKTGSFADRPGGSGDVILTAIGLMAVNELGLPRERYRPKALTFLAEHAREYEETRMAAAGIEAAGEIPREAASRWIAELRAMTNPDGSFGRGAEKARLTAGTVVAILRLGGQVGDGRSILDILDAEQNPDGGFGRTAQRDSDLETTYRVMRCYHMLGGKPARKEALERWLKSCRASEGGYGIRPGQPPTVGATYFAAMVLSWLDGR